MHTTPIFVLGMPRSGTTLTGGIIAQHSMVAGIVSERYRGLKESAIFGPMDRYFGDLNNPIDFVRFVETFAAGDYFQLSGTKKELFYREKPKSMAAFFRLLMDDYSKRNNCDFWVEKSPIHLLHFENILREFPDAIIVVVCRDLQECIRSSLGIRRHLSTWYYLWTVFKTAILYSIYQSRLDDLKKAIIPTSKIVVHYKDLSTDLKNAGRHICQTIGIPFEDSVGHAPYAPNTSFFNKGIVNNGDNMPTKLHHIIIQCVVYGFRLLPKKVKFIMAQCLLRRPKRPMAHHWGILFERYDFEEKRWAPGGWSGVPEHRPL